MTAHHQLATMIASGERVGVDDIAGTRIFLPAVVRSGFCAGRAAARTALLAERARRRALRNIQPMILRRRLT
jgi:hypothetical protein